MTPPTASTSPLTARARQLRPPAFVGVLRAITPLLVGLAIAAVLHFWVRPLMPNEFYTRVMLDAGINIILAVSLTMVNGFTGQFSMGHAAFMAVGAYTAAGLVYYGSARLYQSDDFRDASLHAGYVSTMLDDRLIEAATGEFAVSDGKPAFVFDDDTRLYPSRSYLLRLDAETPHESIPVQIAKRTYAESESLPIAAALPEGWDGEYALLFVKRQAFSEGDALFLGAVLAGGLVAALTGYLVGLPSLRLRGDYLAIVTLGFGEIVRILIQSQTTDSIASAEQILATPIYKLPHHLGGPVGFTGLPFYTSIFWVWLFTIITIAVAFRLKESTFGRAFLSIREDEIAAEAMGVRTTKFKVRAFVIAAFFAGIAGGLFAHTIGIQLNAGELGFQRSFDIIIMVVLGGMGSISGAAVAAVILTILPELLRRPPSVLDPTMLAVFAFGALLILLFTRRRVRSILFYLAAIGAYEGVRRLALYYGINLADYRMLLYALALILMMILRPQGLFGLRELWNAWRIHPLRKRRDFAEGGPSGQAGKVPTL